MGLAVTESHSVFPQLPSPHEKSAKEFRLDLQSVMQKTGSSLGSKETWANGLCVSLHFRRHLMVSEVSRTSSFPIHVTDKPV